MATRFKVVTGAEEYKMQPRVHRRPKETFNLKYKPYEICPFMFHPVLPGETLDSAFLQARVVTDKVKSNLVGWWQEKHIFYVPLRTIIDADIRSHAAINDGSFANFFLTTTTLATTLPQMVEDANNTPYYSFKSGAIWLEALFQFVVRTWFRDEGEADAGKGAALALLDQYPPAQIDELRETWANSLKLESAGADDAELPGEDELEELDILPGFTTIYSQWELMRDEGMTDLSYRDYLKSYGISVPEDVAPPDEPSGVPIVEAEKLRTIRKWSYPTLAPQPGEANTSNVVYWSEAERITKRRFFGEPGFLLGVTVTKPKLYLGNQKGHAAGLLNSTLSWLPAVLSHLPYTSVKEELDSLTDGIFQNQTEDYWLDVKDVFKYGGQFMNHAIGAAAHQLALPDATLSKYPTEALIDSLFSVTDGTASYVYEDGAAHLDILGKIRDTTPR